MLQGLAQDARRFLQRPLASNVLCDDFFWMLQDIGVAMLVRLVAPSLPIHASTQMSITSADGADFAHQLGAKRVVVGRELSIADISAVSTHTNAEVEAFVHGALCVSYRCVLPYFPL